MYRIFQLQPGDYMVRYDPAAGFSVLPLLPAQVEISRLTVTGDALTAGQPLSVTALLLNRGGEDALNTSVELSGTQTGQAALR